jgi:hypothetical protein
VNSLGGGERERAEIVEISVQFSVPEPGQCKSGFNIFTENGKPKTGEVRLFIATSKGMGWQDNCTMQKWSRANEVRKAR